MERKNIKSNRNTDTAIDLTNVAPAVVKTGKARTAAQAGPAEEPLFDAEEAAIVGSFMSITQPLIQFVRQFVVDADQASSGAECAEKY